MGGVTSRRAFEAGCRSWWRVLRRHLATVGVSIDTAEGGYRLAVAPDEVDHVRFRAVADRSDAGRRELDEALALWRGLRSVSSATLRSCGPWAVS